MIMDTVIDMRTLTDILQEPPRPQLPPPPPAPNELVARGIDNVAELVGDLGQGLKTGPLTIIEKGFRKTGELFRGR